LFLIQSGQRYSREGSEDTHATVLTTCSGWTMDKNPQVSLSHSFTTTVKVIIEISSTFCY